MGAGLLADVSEGPFWASGAVIGAVIAGLGYVGKQFVDLLLGLWRNHKTQRARLIALRSLLRASNATFLAQQKLAERLYESLAAANPQQAFSDGYERVFAQSFQHFSPEQRELHSVIRGMTEHSMRPLNAAISKWLKRDTTFKVPRRSGGPRAELASKLIDLEAHLVLWLAKYRAWIPGHDNHALVYLADEEQTGVGFPTGVDQLVEKLMRKPSGPKPVLRGKLAAVTTKQTFTAERRRGG
jgi:hypothetical protein